MKNAKFKMGGGAGAVLAFLILCFALFIETPRAAAQLVTASITITNLPTNDFSTIAVASDTRTWETNLTAPSTQILLTTNAVLNASNLLSALIANRFAGFSPAWPGATNIVTLFGAGPLTVTVSAGWASVTYATNMTSAQTNVAVPMSAWPAATRTNVATQLANDLDQNSTYAIRSNSPMMANFAAIGSLGSNYVSLTTAQTVAGAKDFTNTGNVFIGSGLGLTSLPPDYYDNSYVPLDYLTGGLVLNYKELFIAALYGFTVGDINGTSRITFDTTGTNGNTGMTALSDQSGISQFILASNVTTLNAAKFDIYPSNSSTADTNGLYARWQYDQLYAPLVGGLVPPSYLGGGSSLSQAILTRSGWQVFSSGGTVTSVGIIGDSVSTGAAPLGSPVTASGNITLQPATANANTFVAGPVSGGAASLTQRGIVNADIAGVPQANATSFGTLAAHDSVTNFYLDFSAAQYQTVYGSGDVCFTAPTNGPGAVSVTVLGNANGTARNILWPTNFITLNTNGLLINGTNYQMILTNNGNYRVAQCSFIARTNNAPDTNVVGMCVVSP